jgi:pSer/pThr/pTyr-binding forkhead associated (FHA) protein
MNAVYSNRHVERMVNDALRISLASARLNNEHPNLILLTVTIDSQVPSEVAYCVTLVRESLVGLCVDKQIAQEFVALIRVNHSYVEAGLKGHVWQAFKGKRDGDGLYKLIVGLTGEALTTSESDIRLRIRELRSCALSNLDYIICYPDSFLELTTFDGKKLRITHQYNIGRSAQRDTYVIPDKSVSAQHAVLSVNRNGDWYLFDHSSYNGTKLNGVPVRDAALLHDGDIITIAERYDLTVSAIGPMETMFFEDEEPVLDSAPSTEGTDETHEAEAMPKRGKHFKKQTPMPKADEGSTTASSSLSGDSSTEAEDPSRLSTLPIEGRRFRQRQCEETAKMNERNAVAKEVIPVVDTLDKSKENNAIAESVEHISDTLDKSRGSEGIAQQVISVSDTLTK